MLSVDYVNKLTKTMPFIKSGVYASVYDMQDGRVLKVASNDGTRNWLEFCMLMQSRGEHHECMPRVDCVVPYCANDGYGYIAIMEKLDANYAAYRSQFPSGECSVRELYPEVVQAFCDYLEHTGAYLYDSDSAWNDVHGGNVLWRNGTPVVTDPSSSEYAILDDTPEFYLQ